MRSLVIPAVIAVTGCGSLTTFQTAEPLPAGRWQVAAAVSGASYRDRELDTRVPSAQVEVAVRRGVGADTDVGLKLYTLGAEASVKHRFVAGCWQLAGLASVGGAITHGDGALPDAGFYDARLALIATRRTSPAWAWNLGPVATGSLFLPAGGGTGTGLLLGGFASAAWTFGGAWQLVPELSLHATALGDRPVKGVVGELGVGVARTF
jgi:hypothetical protein